MFATPVDYLISRRSCKFVQAPAPNEAELQQILQAAMAAPDHGRLRPWRFKLIRDEAIGRFTDRTLAILQEAGKPLKPEKEATTRRWLERVPLLIAIACRMDHSNTKIPEEERMLATGAAVTNMLNAIHMLGYAAFWSTGLGSYVDEVAEALGFDPLDYRFMGYLAVGTPIDPLPMLQRPDYREFVTEWTG